MYDILFLCCIFGYSLAENQLDMKPQFLLHKATHPFAILGKKKKETLGSSDRAS